MSTINEIESVLGLLNGIDSGKMDEVWAGFAQKISASAAKDIGEAKEILGEDFQDYVPRSRQAMRSKRDDMRLKHEEAMLALELRAREAQILILEAQAQRISNNDSDS